MKIEFTENLKGLATTAEGISESVNLSDLRISLEDSTCSLMGAMAKIKPGSLQIGLKTYLVNSGHFQYFVVDQNTYKMFYRLFLTGTSSDNKDLKYQFKGEKILKPAKTRLFNIFAIWPQTTTVYFKLTIINSEIVVAQGVLKIGLFSFLKQTLSFCVEESKSNLDTIFATGRFLKKFSVSLLRIYFLK